MEPFWDDIQAPCESTTKDKRQAFGSRKAYDTIAVWVLEKRVDTVTVCLLVYIDAVPRMKQNHPRGKSQHIPSFSLNIVLSHLVSP